MKEKGTSESKRLEYTSHLKWRVQQRHRQLADRLSDRFNRCSRGVKRLLLASFVLAGIGACTWALVQGFSTGAGSLIRVDHIDQPQIPAFQKHRPSLSKEEYDRFHSYRLYLDSLQKKGDTTRSRHRDTVVLLEQFYLH